MTVKWYLLLWTQKWRKLPEQSKGTAVATTKSCCWKTISPICSVVLCSYWFLETPDEPINDIKVYHPTSGYSTLPDFLSSFKGSGERPVYIGFGSMEELGFFSSIDCVELLAVLNEGNRCFYCQNDYINSLQKHDAFSDQDKFLMRYQVTNNNILKSWMHICFMLNLRPFFFSLALIYLNLCKLTTNYIFNTDLDFFHSFACFWRSR